VVTSSRPFALTATALEKVRARPVKMIVPTAGVVKEVVNARAFSRGGEDGMINRRTAVPDRYGRLI
jgi:hypothetical protein